MEAFGIHFNYRKENRRSLICCLTTSIIALLPLLIIFYIRNKIKSLIDLFTLIFVSRMLQFGASFQFFISFSILLRKMSIRYAVLNNFLR